MYCATQVRYIFRASLRLYHNNIKHMEYVQLAHTGHKMPTVGLGTWQAPPDVIETTVYNALNLGYRHIDTAFNYNNEEAIGKAIKKWEMDGNGSREDLFITTKLPHIGNRESDVKKFLNMQLARLNLEYVDLYLIHVPFSFQYDYDTLTPKVEKGEYVLDTNTDHVKIWKMMEQCQKENLTRNIGLSNFNEVQILKIIENSTVPPQVLQVEMHAYFQQFNLKKFCDAYNIVLTAYAPLGSPGAKNHFVEKYNYKPEDFPNLLGHPEIKEIAASYGKTPAQILLNFLIRERVVVIPKSTSEERLKENLNIYDFELSDPDMNRLKMLDKGEYGRIFNFLFWKGVEKHPEYPFQLRELS